MASQTSLAPALDVNEDKLSPSERFCLQNAEVLHMLQNHKAAEFELTHIGPEG